LLDLKIQLSSTSLLIGLDSLKYLDQANILKLFNKYFTNESNLIPNGNKKRKLEEDEEDEEKIYETAKRFKLFEIETEEENYKVQFFFCLKACSCFVNNSIFRFKMVFFGVFMKTLKKQFLIVV
jgi:hypothetical protein